LELSLKVWEAVKEMYRNQNNIVWIFQINRNLVNLQQDDKIYVQLLGILKGWNPERYVEWSYTISPYTVDAT
jgi:hypothetical protein